MIEVRTLKPEDREDWEPLWDGYNRFYERAVPAQVTERTWALLMDGSKEPHGFAAVRDGRVIGFAHYWYQGTTAALLPKCYLQDLFVLPEARGLRIGEKLIEAVYDAADAHGASEVYWLTQHFNGPGRALYDRVGELTPFIKYRRPGE